MKSTSANRSLIGLVWIVGALVWACLFTSAGAAAQSTARKERLLYHDCHNRRREEV